MKLTELEIGQIGRISAIEDSPFKEKLQEMGCVPGVLVKPILKAPLGDPIAYELEEYTLSMRKKEAQSVVVNLLDSLFTAD
ncbi:MAG: FeoA family protein [Bacteroidia bacterium]